MRARLKEDDSEPPQPDGPYAYYARYRHGGQHRIFCRTPRDSGKETVLVDGDALGGGQDFLSSLRCAPFARPRQVRLERRRQGLRASDDSPCATSSAADLPDRIDNCTGHVVWMRDSRRFLYVGHDENHRPWRVLLHRLGEPRRPRSIFEEADPAWFINVSPTRLGVRRSSRCMATMRPRALSSISATRARRRASSRRVARACAMM